MSLLDTKVVHETGLGVGNHTNDRAIFRDTVELTLNTLLSHLGSISAESTLLGLCPVLVQTALESIVELRSPDSDQSTKTTRSADVSNDTDNVHGRSFDDGHSLDDFLVMNLCNTAPGNTKKNEEYRKNVRYSGTETEHERREGKLPKMTTKNEHTGTRLLDKSNDVGHTGFPAHECSEVRRTLSRVTWEGLDCRTKTAKEGRGESQHNKRTISCPSSKF